MIISVHQPQYLPWLGYFDKIARSDAFVFLDNVQYKGREFQNRNKIRTKDGWLWLTVPVICKGLGRQKICSTNIDNSSGWGKGHLKSIKTWYARTEFLKAHLPFFAETYSQNWVRLMELNVHIINYILKQLSITTPIYFASQLDISSEHTERIIEICQKLKADTYLSGSGGKNYLEEDKFAAAGIKLVYQEFKHPQYRQQFMKNEEDFLPFMSILDLLFNAGPKAREILLCWEGGTLPIGAKGLP